MIANAVAGEPAQATAGRRRPYDRSGHRGRLLDAATDRFPVRGWPGHWPGEVDVGGYLAELEDAGLVERRPDGQGVIVRGKGTDDNTSEIERAGA